MEHLCFVRGQCGGGGCERVVGMDDVGDSRVWTAVVDVHIDVDVIVGTSAIRFVIGVTGIRSRRGP